MRERTAKLAVCVVVPMIITLLAPCMRAQEAEATRSGKVTDSSGTAVANAKVSAKNLATSQLPGGHRHGRGVWSGAAVGIAEVLNIFDE